MAGHVARKVTPLGGSVKVWNRTVDKARKHASEFGTKHIQDLKDLAGCEVIFSMLPTTKEVVEISLQVPNVGVWVDCTSGDPVDTASLAQNLAEKGTKLVDCPVSGGPRGAHAGTVTAMLGGDEEDIAKVRALVSTFAGKIERCGPVGSGMATKCVNNILNCCHLAAASEGLIALQKFGVDPQRALELINLSSGRSLQTQVRIPEEVISRRFAYGFKLGLMRKDCETAGRVLAKHNSDARILSSALQVVQDSEEAQGPDADYSEIVRFLEKQANTELR
eukprot:gnl/MRDRNA2_/MRDRNA2_169797_c0_seq1.p1 gnl/MRDRNA2_/MRDRNA2_169797_c0~~gnl/MRDRNA2_/MRDRNA2_169797_c0_seq1.p1  ORF type:complete len:326 (-),score=69.71 gnl/MRDRNA2_/MRDRNA2_169797_c0_seq1:76-909(-)